MTTLTPVTSGNIVFSPGRSVPRDHLSASPGSVPGTAGTAFSVTVSRRMPTAIRRRDEQYHDYVEQDYRCGHGDAQRDLTGTIAAARTA